MASTGLGRELTDLEDNALLWVLNLPPPLSLQDGVIPTRILRSYSFYAVSCNCSFINYHCSQEPRQGLTFTHFLSTSPEEGSARPLSPGEI